MPSEKQTQQTGTMGYRRGQAHVFSEQERGEQSFHCIQFWTGDRWASSGPLTDMLPPDFPKECAESPEGWGSNGRRKCERWVERFNSSEAAKDKADAK